jgi:hypothetical protein
MMSVGLGLVDIRQTLFILSALPRSRRRKKICGATPQRSPGPGFLFGYVIVSAIGIEDTREPEAKLEAEKERTTQVKNEALALHKQTFAFFPFYNPSKS